MLTVRKANERGRADFGWLDSHHTFSFGNYYDADHMGFRALRVLNDDRVVSGAGFPTHSHRDMEIISYVLEGALAHKDSLGNGAVMRPGDVQLMTAGSGVTHSELNPEPAPLHFLQIWIVPEQRNLQPGYEQRSFAPSERNNQLRLLASRDGREGSVTVHQDVSLYGTLLGKDQRVTQTLAEGRHGFVHVANGSVRINDVALQSGDAAAISSETKIELVGSGDAPAEVLLFDLA